MIPMNAREEEEGDVREDAVWHFYAHEMVTSPGISTYANGTDDICTRYSWRKKMILY